MAVGLCFDPYDRVVFVNLVHGWFSEAAVLPAAISKQMPTKCGLWIRLNFTAFLHPDARNPTLSLITERAVEF
jgi:hypothetical protein